MYERSQEQIDSPVEGSPRAKASGRTDKPRSVQPCNFRSAGRLSNENARALTGLHETFARFVASILEIYLGRDLKVKLSSLEQLPVKELIASIPAFSYLSCFPLGAIPGSMMVGFDIDLAFPMIDLLLGGTGASVGKARDLSEIEEEIMQELTLLVARQAQSAWAIEEMPLAAGPRVKAAAMHMVCPASEKGILVRFEIEVIGITGAVQVIFPASLVSVLVKQNKASQPQKKGMLRFFPASNIRERILDCDIAVASDLPSIKVSVRDLIALQPGFVLKLRAPVRSPGMLTVGGRGIFEAVPVRNGIQKAAQVGDRMQLTSWGKD